MDILGNLDISIPRPGAVVGPAGPPGDKVRSGREVPSVRREISLREIDELHML